MAFTIFKNPETAIFSINPAIFGYDANTGLNNGKSIKFETAQQWIDYIFSFTKFRIIMANGDHFTREDYTARRAKNHFNKFTKLT